jgi:hypothetical protein
VLEASQAGSVNYNPASVVNQSFSVVNPGAAKINQTITFGTLGYKTYTSPAFELTATLSSGYPVVYRVVSGPIAISGKVVTITGVGSATIEASHPGDANYNAAIPVQRSFTVGKGSQNITFVAPTAKTSNNPPFALTATASSNLPVIYRVVSGPATISGNIVTLTGGSGTVTLEATQPGNEYYNAAFSLQRSFTVLPGNNTQPPINVSHLQEKPLNPVVLASKLTIYPNPASAASTIRIVVDRTITGRLALYDKNGRQVKQFGRRLFEKGVPQQVAFDLSDLGSGIYYMQLQLPAGTLSTRFEVLK